MKIAVFGASGKIGKFIVSHALKNDYKVIAYVRDPKKLNMTHPSLTILKGELNDFPMIKAAIKDCDAVISALGMPLSLFEYPEYPVLEGHNHIMKAMKEEGISRFITLTTPSVKFEHDVSSFVTNMPGRIAGIFFRDAKKEIIEIGEAVENSSLDWTIVRIISPTNGAFTGKVRVTFGDKPIKMSISREDIAVFMLNQVKDNTYIKSMPIIGG